jgi:hypothetical protein
MGGLGSSGDLAFSPAGTLFGTATGGGATNPLVRINPTTGQATVVGDIGFAAVYGLAFGPDGTLYGAANGETSPSLLITINTTTGVGTAVFNNALHLFVRGTDNRIYVNLLSGTSWTGWREVPGGGRTPAGPTAAVFQSSLYLVVRGTDNRIYDNLLTLAGWSKSGGGRERRW